ncbi:MAG: type II toxin-antitoxin system RelE/ParE family toxin [Chitinophagales bacterium]
MEREIIFYENHFADFFVTLGDKAKEKLLYSLDIVKSQEIVPNKFMRHITNSDGVYEVRASSGSNQYRVLCFFEEGDLISGGKIVVLGNGFIKKSKTKELKRALRIAEMLKVRYFEELKAKEIGETDVENEGINKSDKQE